MFQHRAKSKPEQHPSALMPSEIWVLHHKYEYEKKNSDDHIMLLHSLSVCVCLLTVIIWGWLSVLDRQICPALSESFSSQTV